MNHPLSETSLRPTDLAALAGRLARLRIGVIGDLALDVYFDLQTDTGEHSLETGLPVHWGRRVRASPGAAGNVVQNLQALGVGQISVFGVVGSDLYGRELRHQFAQRQVHTDHLLIADDPCWDTCVYVKPMQAHTEASRIDFGSENRLTETLFSTLLHRLSDTLPQLDALIINQQFRCPLLTPERISLLNDLVLKHPSVHYFADLRDHGTLIRGATLKVNTAELGRFLSVAPPPAPNSIWCIEHGTALARRIGGPLLVTRGEAGMLYIDPNGVWSVDGLPLNGPLDTVGAGDTVVAALAAARSAGADVPQSMVFANTAAAVTVRKLGQTGTASVGEIQQLLIQYADYEPRNHPASPSGTAHAPHPTTSSLLDEP